MVHYLVDLDMFESSVELGNRIRGHLECIGAISDTPPSVGWTRLAFSSKEDEVHGYASRVLEELGFCVWTDEFMNLYGDSFSGHRDGPPTIMLGTHLDTVSKGGNYDGVVGLIVAVEALRELRHRGTKTPPIRVAIFRAEESTRFNKACLGSRAAFLGLTDDELSLSFESSPEIRTSLQQCVDAAGGSGAKLKHPTLGSSACRAYFETHIEQARVLEHYIALDLADDLENPPATIGIVTSIRAPHRCEWEVTGERSASLFAKCVLAVESVAMLLDSCSLDIVSTIGRVDGFVRGADKINAVPGDASFALTGGIPDNLIQQAFDICKRRGCALEVHEVGSRFELQVSGTTDHSGGTPMGLSHRRDALVAASEIIGILPHELLAPCKSLRFRTDVRSNSIPTRDLANSLISSTFEQIDSFERITHGTTCARVEKLGTTEMSDPIDSLSISLQNTVAKSAAELGINFAYLPSGAGHDAMMAAISGIPTSLMFIPSIKGLSHTPDEHSRVKDIVAAILVQASVLEKMLDAM